MSEFEFLRKMYFRLREAENFCALAHQNGAKKKDVHEEAWVAAISCSIKDFLEYRKEQK